MKSRKILSAAILILLGVLVASCKVSYSFTGTSIQSDVSTITINYVEYRALKVNPNLSNQMTEALKEKFRKLTRLEQVDEEGDLELYCEITGYNVQARAITAEEAAARRRVTVTVKCKFTNRKHSEDDFDKNFSAYADFDANTLLDSVQDSLCEEIVEKLVDDIFTASVAQW